MGKKKRQQLDDAIREASGQSSDEVMRMAGVLTAWAVLKQRRFFAAVAEATKDANPALASDPPSSTTVRKLAIELAELDQLSEVTKTVRELASMIDPKRFPPPTPSDRPSSSHAAGALTSSLALLREVADD